MAQTSGQSVLVIYVREEHEVNWRYADSFISTLSEQGFETIVISNFDPPAAFSTAPPHFYRLDFSSPERDRQMIEIARQHAAGLVLSLGDWAANAVGAINEALGLSGYRNQALKNMIHKDAADVFCRAHGIRMPESRIITALSQFADPVLQKPLIVKPAHGTGMVKVRDYHYTIFPSLAAFKAELEDSGELDDFLVSNRQPGFFGRHVVQEYVVHDRFVMVNFAYVQGQVEILQIGRHYYPGRYKIKPYAVGTPEVLSSTLEAEIRRILGVFQTQLPVGNTFASIQFLIDENEVPYPIDIHLRLGEAKGLLLTHFEPDVFAGIVRALLGGTYQPRRPTQGYRIKYSLLLQPGEFREIAYPDYDPQRLQLCNMDYLEQPRVIPEDPSFESLGSYLILENPAGKAEAWQEAETFVRNVRVDYLKEAHV